jgi:hypothetical protein
MEAANDSSLFVCSVIALKNGQRNNPRTAAVVNSHTVHKKQWRQTRWCAETGVVSRTEPTRKNAYESKLKDYLLCVAN